MLLTPSALPVTNLTRLIAVHTVKVIVFRLMPRLRFEFFARHDTLTIVTTGAAPPPNHIEPPTLSERISLR